MSEQRIIQDPSEVDPQLIAARVQQAQFSVEAMQILARAPQWSGELTPAGYKVMVAGHTSVAPSIEVAIFEAAKKADLVGVND